MKKKQFFYFLIFEAVATIFAAVSLFDYIERGDKFHIKVTGLCLFASYTAFILFLIAYKKYRKPNTKNDIKV